MPSILQLPPLYGPEPPPPDSDIGNPLSLRNARPIRKEAVDESLHKNPFALLDEEIDLEADRSRIREAFWVSLIVHALGIVFIILALPKLLERHALPTPLEQFLQDKQLQFVELPPSPKTTPPPDTSKISDQDRVAALRRPSQQQLKELMDANRAGAPGMQPTPAQPAQQPSGQTADNQQQVAANMQPPVANGMGPSSPQGRSASPFNMGMSAGSQIQQAVQAAAQNRGSGVGGDYGEGPTPQNTKLHSDLEILSDTMGFDFDPYLRRVIAAIRENWYNIIPEEARAPLRKQGKLTIYFVIQKDGTVAGMHYLAQSGDVALDRAAYGGITASNPFQPLPAGFHGQYLALACTFYYNPDRNDLR